MLNLPLGMRPVALLTALILSGCASAPTPGSRECSCPKVEKPAIQEQKDAVAALPLFEKSDFSRLPGWQAADHSALLNAFVQQCSNRNNALAKRKATPASLLQACEKARDSLGQGFPMPARTWLENNFEVWQLQQEDGRKEGLLTGYYEPRLKGSRTAKGPFNTPLYAMPADLVVVKLDELYPELKGKRLRGRLQGNSLVPYFDRAEWERIGPQREKPIVWVNDPLDAFLLQVQGSGRVTLPDGTEIRLSYAEQNGHPYKSIGKVLVDRGELTASQATIPGIRAWAAANPGRLDELLNSNPSVVFFKENKVLSPKDGPAGAMGLPLTGELSLAIDREKIPYGSLMWIESSNPVTQAPIQQGVLAQDTGGAIRGRVRADYFWGTGEEAGHAAGLTRQSLKMWMLWPKGAPLPQGGS